VSLVREASPASLRQASPAPVSGSARLFLPDASQPSPEVDLTTICDQSQILEHDVKIVQIQPEIRRLAMEHTLLSAE
jgi:hypothetical protein